MEFRLCDNRRSLEICRNNGRRIKKVLKYESDWTFNQISSTNIVKLVRFHSRVVYTAGNPSLYERTIPKDLQEKVIFFTYSLPGPPIFSFLGVIFQLNAAIHVWAERS